VLMSNWLSPKGLEDRAQALVSFREQLEFKGSMSIPAVTTEVSKPGDCGRPYVVKSAAMHRPLIGIHVWGVDHANKRTGVADFTSEMICDAEDLIDERIGHVIAVEEMDFAEIDLEVEPRKCCWWNSELELHGIATVRKEPLARFQPGGTAFVRTNLIHNEWTDVYAPAAQKVCQVGDLRVHPLYTNAQKFDSRMENLPPLRYHFEAIRYMQSKVDEMSSRMRMSEHDAINGTEVMKPIVLSTSAGYWQKYLTRGKKDFFDELDQRMDDGEVHRKEYAYSDLARNKKIPIWDVSFCDHMDRQEKRISQGKAVNTFWTATTKDELLDVKKVKIGKTRVFVQPGLEITLLMRKYFGDFTDWYKSQAGFRLCHGIGRDKEEVWGKYLEGLEEVGLNGFDLDYTNYDGSVSELAVEAFLAVCEAYYGNDGKVERRALMQSVTHSLMVVGDYLTETVQGNKSGNPITDVLNSITNWYHVLLAYQATQFSEGLVVDIESFTTDVRCLTYGDDVIISAKDETLKWFNRASVASILGVMGLTVTAADKSDKLIPCEPLGNLTFLKSPFVRSKSGAVFAPLPVKVIHRELIWEKKVNVGDVVIMEQKVDAALRMMAHHGRGAVEELVWQLREQGVDAKFDYSVWLRELLDKQEIAVVQGVQNQERFCGFSPQEEPSGGDVTFPYWGMDVSDDV